MFQIFLLNVFWYNYDNFFHIKLYNLNSKLNKDEFNKKKIIPVSKCEHTFDHFFFLWRKF